MPNRRIPLLAAGGALAGLALVNRTLAERAKRDHPPIGRFLDVDGVRLHYLERGSGPPILFVHGNGTMIEDWIISGVMDDLAKTNRVIAVDRPGFGHSSRPRGTQWTANRQAALLAEFLQRLDVENAVVGGHSFGALVTAAMALNHPQRLRAVALLGGYYYPTPRIDAWLVAPSAIPGIGDVLRHTVIPLLGHALRRRFTARLFGPAPVTDAWRELFPWSMALRPSGIRAGSADAALMIPAAAALAPRYPEIDLPVAIVAGRGDRMVHTPTQSERLHQALPKSRLQLHDGIGHMVHHNAPGEVAAAIRLL
jgi:pimeloyl-ACP methyl ester carboxylesterase